MTPERRKLAVRSGGVLGACAILVAIACSGSDVPFVAIGLALALVVGALVLATASERATRSRTVDPVAAAAFAACVVAFVAGARAGTRGVTGNVATSAILVASFVGAVVARHYAFGARGAFYRRGGFWVLTAQAVVGLPSLGAIGLFDPWEAHYGEVAREMLARHDAVSTFWGHEGWFTSKPVLLFWLQAIALRVCGVHPEPGRVLEGTLTAAGHPEWALRLPIFFVATLGTYVLYMCFRRALGDRRALAGVIAIATTPFWVFLARQSITDMPLVGFLSAAMGLLLAATTASDDRVAVHELALGPLRLRVHAGHAVAALAALVIVPQAIYLVAQTLSLEDGVALRPDVVREGSPGNCTLPGQVPCSEHAPHVAFSPLLQGLVWLVLGVALFVVLAHEQRRKRVLAQAAWVFAALAAMAKGPLGLALPLGTLVVYAFVVRRPRLILELVPLPALACAACMILPWYVATYVRHGRLFVDELVLRHMLGRTLDHLHDTNDGDDTSVRYYLVQLAFGLGPWMPVVVLGVARALSPRAQPAERFLAIWAAIAFALVTIMRTKFHHYVFPAVPPLALLAGASLVRERGPDGVNARPALGLVIVTMVLALLVGRALLGEGDAEGPARLVHLFTYQYARPWPATVQLGAPLAALAALGLVLPIVAYTKRGAWPALGAAIAGALFLGNVYLAQTAPHWGQRAIVDAWYPHRAESNAPVVAYRLNWKGENFYFGNRLAILGATAGNSGGPLSTYVGTWRAKGAPAIYLITERHAIDGVRAEAGAPIEVLTTEADSRQFCLIRIVL